jgi:hypothetical protein
MKRYDPTARVSRSNGAWRCSDLGDGQPAAVVVFTSIGSFNGEPAGRSTYQKEDTVLFSSQKDKAEVLDGSKKRGRRVVKQRRERTHSGYHSECTINSNAQASKKEGRIITVRGWP